MKSFKDKIKGGAFYNEPFPYLVVPNFFSSEKATSAVAALKNAEDYDDLVMGGRNRLTKGSPRFDQLLKKSETLRAFYQELNNRENYVFLMEHFKEGMSASSVPFGPPEELLSANFKKQHSSYEKMFFQNDFLKRVSRRILNEFHSLSEKLSGNFVFFDCDFSVSREGYFREPHHDNPHRILNFILYFNDIAKEHGGALEVFEYANKGTTLVRQPSLEDVNLVKKIQPTEGTLILFLSTPLSIHGVSLLKGESTRRYFSYGSYSLNKNVDWIKT